LIIFDAPALFVFKLKFDLPTTSETGPSLRPLGHGDTQPVQMDGLRIVVAPPDGCAGLWWSRERDGRRVR
jgi:hypothetical protein